MMKSNDHFIRNLLTIVLLLPLLPCISNAEPYTAIFHGSITEESVRNFKKKYVDIEIKYLDISSGGGQLLPSIELADWVREKNIVVKIRGICASACANFVFPAAHEKLIVSPGLVIWHGSAEQKSVRDEQEKFEEEKRIYETAKPPASSTENQNFAKRQERFEMIQKQRVAQAVFYQRIGMNERLTRLGQEPVQYDIEWWTATPELMKAFGIDNVNTPENYGTAQYLAGNIFAKTMFRGKVAAFERVTGEVGYILKTP
jgi:hypothetical protein